MVVGYTRSLTSCFLPKGVAVFFIYFCISLQSCGSTLHIIASHVDNVNEPIFLYHFKQT